MILEVLLVGSCGAIMAIEPVPFGFSVILLHAPAEQIIASTVIKTLQKLSTASNSQRHTQQVERYCTIQLTQYIKKYNNYSCTHYCNYSTKILLYDIYCISLFREQNTALLAPVWQFSH